MSVPVAYLAIVLIWSTTPLAIKWSGEGPGFLLGALGRMALAAVLCLALVLALRLKLPWHREARRAYAGGAVGAYGAMLCVYWAAQYVPSGVIAVLFGMAPFVTALLARWLLGERGLTAAKISGMLVGLAGLVVIFGSSLALGRHAPAGLAALCVAVVLHSLSLVTVKRYSGGLPALTVTSGALLIVVPMFLATWALAGAQLPAAWPPQALAAIAYLGVIGSVIGFTLYFYVLKHVAANTVALITLITPVLALLLGGLVGHEHVTPQVWSGTALVVGGLALHQWGGQLARLVPAAARRE